MITEWDPWSPQATLATFDENRNTVAVPQSDTPTDLTPDDTPPRSETAALHGAKVADLVVIPYRAHILDIKTVTVHRQRNSVSSSRTPSVARTPCAHRCSRTWTSSSTMFSRLEPEHESKHLPAIENGVAVRNGNEPDWKGPR